jgi:hypothetical protein
MRRLVGFNPTEKFPSSKFRIWRPWFQSIVGNSIGSVVHLRCTSIERIARNRHVTRICADEFYYSL